jgi:3-dehydroquinate synthase
MEGLLVHNFSIQSYSGPYQVEFNNSLINNKELTNLGSHFIIDRNIFSYLGGNFLQQIEKKNFVLIDATEETKSYRGIEPVLSQLLEQQLKKDSVLVAIGGGITQDITCFIANTFMRGIKWVFVPTTLLSQADSCIGSKSSINFGKTKNILGSFTPPQKVIISDQFLTTLEEKDIKSGIGEIIKLYLVNGQLVTSDEIRNDLTKHLYATLQIKKKYIEQDEFDVGVRNILNYGHCFGHAIESSTDFGIPHGIAVTMGMDIANKFSQNEGLITEKEYLMMHTVLFSNYTGYNTVPVKIDPIFTALSKDKKNTGSKINLILPVNGTLEKRGFENNSVLVKSITNTLRQLPINFVD